MEKRESYMIFLLRLVPMEYLAMLLVSTVWYWHYKPLNWL